MKLDDGIHVQSIGFHKNELGSLNDNPEYLRYVKKLELNSNPIERISPAVLNKLKNLEYLRLTDVPIKGSDNMFAPLEKLKTLIMQKNNLTKLEADWFSELEALDTLEFNLNDVKEFDYMALLRNLPRLKHLDINGNDFRCSFLREMVVYLKSINRVGVLRDSSYGERPETNPRGDIIFGIRCDVKKGSKRKNKHRN